MICSKCKSDGVKNQALGKDFYYCRTCKEEIEMEGIIGDDYLEMTQMTQAEVDDLFEQLTRGII